MKCFVEERRKKRKRSRWRKRREEGKARLKIFPIKEYEEEVKVLGDEN